MKYLLVFLLLSCGKHEEPRALDLQDNDGDQIPNYQEGSIRKNIANVDTLGKVKGTIRFNIIRPEEISFSNQIDQNESAFKLMVLNQDKIKTEEFFSEWSDLILEKSIDIKRLNLKEYTLWMDFDHDSDKANDIHFIMNGKVTKKLKWSPKIKILLQKEELKSLLAQKAYFSLRKKLPQSSVFEIHSGITITNNTYRVHYHDGNKSKILYVSNKLPFPELLKQLNIKETFSIDPDDLFFNSNFPDHDQWYVRELKSKDVVLLYSNKEILKRWNFKNFEIERQTLKRENGLSLNSLSLNNKAGAKVFLKISKLHKTELSFRTKAIKKVYSGGGGGGREGNAEGPIKCTHYLRYIDKEEAIPVDLEFLTKDLLTHPHLFEGAEVLQQQHENGLFWEVKLNNLTENLTLQLADLPVSSYLTTGEYKTSCSDGGVRTREKKHQTNLERKFSLVVESFVEKID